MDGWFWRRRKGYLDKRLLLFIGNIDNGKSCFNFFIVYSDSDDTDFNLIWKIGRVGESFFLSYNRKNIQIYFLFLIHFFLF